MNLSVIIPTWNRKELLKNLLLSLKEVREKIEVIVVDNASTDGTKEMLKREFPWVKVLSLMKNMGYAPALNEGTKIARGKFLLFLNNDTIVKKGSIEKFLSIKKDGDFFSPLVLRMDGKIDSCGDCFPPDGRPYKRRHGKSPEGISFERIFSAPGSSFFVKKDAFLEVGKFDDDFFAYFEDVDLSFRLNLMGYRGYLLPDIVIYHLEGGTAGKGDTPLKTRYLARNRVFLIYKNLPLPLLIRYLPWFVGGTIKSLIYHTFISNMLPYAFLGMMEGIFKLWKKTKERRWIQKKRKVDIGEIRKWIEDCRVLR